MKTKVQIQRKGYTRIVNGRSIYVPPHLAKVWKGSGLRKRDNHVYYTNEEAENEGFAIPEHDQKWLDGEFKEPKNIGVGYKVFVVGKDGKLYPPMVANANAVDTPIGKWLPAYAPPIQGYNTLKRPSVKAGGKGTKGTGSGYLAWRPGWHLGEIPYAEQFLQKNGKLPSNLVFAECHYSRDHDYGDEERKTGMRNGKYVNSYGGLLRIPKNGYYKYRTRVNYDPWIITGNIKVNKILTREECQKLCKKAGKPIQEWND